MYDLNCLQVLRATGDMAGRRGIRRWRSIETVVGLLPARRGATAGTVRFGMVRAFAVHPTDEEHIDRFTA